MEIFDIQPGTDEERDWAAAVMASTDPWMTLGRGLDSCRVKTHDPDYVFLVARRKGQPLGFILIHPHGLAGSPYIGSIAVADGSRGCGVGGALLRYAEECFRTRARYLFLCVSSFNSRAQALYQRQGYRKVGELRDYIIEGASEILMQKHLSEK